MKDRRNTYCTLILLAWVCGLLMWAVCSGAGR